MLPPRFRHHCIASGRFAKESLSPQQTRKHEEIGKTVDKFDFEGVISVFTRYYPIHFDLGAENRPVRNEKRMIINSRFH
jgi:hypothetical protein